MADSTETSPRGTKREADGTELPRRIVALHQDVVNKIAAGEIIVAPVHALKELMENAIDAGATQLEILVKEGGMKLLQITDNGCGINKDDLSILCERFTTSKLKDFEDLMDMHTYGFRGEALASISHIAHLTVTTKTSESPCAWKAYYAGGKLAAPKPGQTEEPKPTAGRQGTQIQVEDLFYNMSTRRRAFKSPSEEYAKIAEMVGKYAIYCLGVAFSCKKHGDAGASVVVAANASRKDRIRAIFTSAVANELLDLDLDNTELKFKATGHITSVNYNGKKSTLLLFINGRAVESSTIKKAIDETYTTFLPKGGKSFVYLSLDINPAHVDVNMHPTKKEVGFLYESEIVEEIQKAIGSALGSVDASRAFMTQSLGSGSKVPSMSRNSTVAEEEAATPRTAPKKVYENNLVRTDARSQKITALFQQQSMEEEDHDQYDQNDRTVVDCRLATIKELRAEVLERAHEELTNAIATHTYVGVVDDQRRLVAIQSGVKLYLVDYGMYCAEFFHQLGLTDFANFGSLKLDPPLNMMELLELGIDEVREHVNDDIDWGAVAKAVLTHLISRRAMLLEYFSLDISDDGFLHGLPLMLKGYTPCLAKLPAFLLRLGPHVDWTDEKKCFDSFLRELAGYHVPESLPDAAIRENENLASRRVELHQCLEHVLFPTFKARLVATNALLKGTTEIADLKGLYRVFERC